MVLGLPMTARHEVYKIARATSRKCELWDCGHWPDGSFELRVLFEGSLNGLMSFWAHARGPDCWKLPDAISNVARKYAFM